MASRKKQTVPARPPTITPIRVPLPSLAAYTAANPVAERSCHSRLSGGGTWFALTLLAGPDGRGAFAVTVRHMVNQNDIGEQWGIGARKPDGTPGVMFTWEGGVVSEAIESQTLTGVDMMVWAFDPLPASIIPARLAPLDVAKYLPLGSVADYIDQFNTPYRGQIVGEYPFIDLNYMLGLPWKEAIGGDSGSFIGFKIPEYNVYLGPMQTSAENGPCVADAPTQAKLYAAIDGIILRKPHLAAYRPTIADLTRFAKAA